MTMLDLGIVDSKGWQGRSQVSFLKVQSKLADPLAHICMLADVGPHVP